MLFVHYCWQESVVHLSYSETKTYGKNSISKFYQSWSKGWQRTKRTALKNFKLKYSSIILERIWRKGTQVHCWRYWILVHGRKHHGAVLQTNIRATFVIQQFHSRVYTQKKVKRLIQKDTCTPVFISSTIYNSQNMETCQVSIKTRLT